MPKPGEYSMPGRAPERVGSQPHRTVAPPTVESPAEISAVGEVFKDALVEAIAAIRAGSRTEMKRETRGLKATTGGVAGALVILAGWLWTQGGDWRKAERAAAVIEAKQAEQDQEMALHLAEPHVTPEQVTELQAQLATIAIKLDLALAQPTTVVVPKAKR